MSPVTNIRLSVLMPCRDAAEHLRQSIRSIEEQSFQDFEVVAVNDGSTDATQPMLERWANRDHRVRVCNLERVGLPEALRVGADACQGELLARFDADDVAHPLRLAQQIDLLAQHREVAAVGTGVRYFPRDKVGWGARRYERWLNGLANPAVVARDLYVECPIAHPTLMIRRSVFDEVGGYQSNLWPEDYDLVFRLHFAGARLTNVPRVLHFWRQGEGRLSRNDARYSPAAFRRCKISYLLKGPLSGHEEVAIWGAGRVGKNFALSLSESGVRVDTFYDIDPRKIGQRINGAPVKGAREVAHHRGSYLLVAVGAAGARETIREELAELGFREPQDYCCVA